MPMFFTKTGWLTDYAMACGYLHKATNLINVDVTFARLECDAPAYRVETYKAHERLTDRVFEGAGAIKAARQEYRKQMGALEWRWERNPEVNRMVIV